MNKANGIGLSLLSTLVLAAMPIMLAAQDGASHGDDSGLPLLLYLLGAGGIVTAGAVWVWQRTRRRRENASRKNDSSSIN